ncbi:DUF362 domain-containing protein [Bacteroidota bacterium]
MEKNEIYLMYGEDGKAMITELLEKINITSEISGNPLIGIKPNLVTPKPSDSGATTDPEIVAGVIEYLQSNGFNNIIILEGAWHGASTKKAFDVCGYNKLSEKYKVPLFDLQQDKTKSFNVEGLEISVCSKALEVDYMINMPVLKAHGQTIMTCALKNHKGCISDREKRRFHNIGLHKPVAYLNKIVRSDLIIVDGIIGDLSSEIGGNPVNTNRIIVGKDPVLVDTYVSELMGIPLSDMEHIKIAYEIGVGSTDLQKATINELNSGADVPDVETKIISFPQRVVAENACSACYGGLMHALTRLKEDGRLNNIDEKIYVGQAFKNKSENGIGIGACTSAFNKNVPGCPPSAKEIINLICS